MDSQLPSVPTGEQHVQRIVGLIKAMHNRESTLEFTFRNPTGHFSDCLRELIPIVKSIDWVLQRTSEITVDNERSYTMKPSILALMEIKVR